MSELKSIAQIAKEIGCSRQAVYQKIKADERLKAALKPHTVKQGRYTVYTPEGEKTLIQAFSEGVKQSVDNVELDSLRKEVDRLTEMLDKRQSELDKLSTQLHDSTVKNAQLTAENSKLTVELDRLTERLEAAAALLTEKDKTISRLDAQIGVKDAQLSDALAAVKAAQALHGLEHAPKQIDVEPDKPEEPERETFGKRLRRFFRKSAE